MEYKYSGTKLKIHRISYYFRSLLILLKEIEPKWWLRFFIDLLLPKIKTVKLKKRKLVFQLKTWLDVLTLKEVVLDEEYESCGVKLDYKDKVIVDIGAGFGDFSIFTAKKFPNTKIFAFEPDSYYFNLLKDNLLLNNVNNVIPIKTQISSLPQVFHLISSHLISSPRIDFLKMDCEGCEFKIITSKHKAMLSKIKKIVLEYHQNSDCDLGCLTNTLIKAGFKVDVLPRKNVENIGMLTAVSFNF